MLKSALHWLGCSLLVVAGLALVLWLPDPIDPAGPELRGAQGARPIGTPGREMGAVPVSFRAQP